MKRWVHYVILAVLCVAVPAAAVGCAGLQRDETLDARQAVVQRGRLLVVVSASGSIQPVERVNLSFETSGRVLEVTARAGARVSLGDVLAELDARQLRLSAEQAAAQLVSAEAQLAMLKNGPREDEVAAAEASVRAAGAQVDAAMANRDQLTGGPNAAQIAAGEADIASFIAQQRSAENFHDLTMTCFSFEHPVTGEEMEICPVLGTPEEQARSSLAAADQGLVAARLRMDELLAGADNETVRSAQANVLAADAQRDSAQAQLDQLLAGATAEQIAAVEAAVAQAQAAVLQAALALEDVQLVAPVDGVVASVDTVPGEQATAGVPVIVIIDASAFQMAVSIDEVDVGRLEIGQTVDIELDAFPDELLEGTVTRIAPAATLLGGVVYYDVLIDLAPTDLPIRPDMSAKATIIAQEIDDVLTIPTWVVRVDRVTGQTYVERRAGSELARADVTLGVRYGGEVQVFDGLSEGDVVVLQEVSGAFGFGGE